MSTVKPVDGGFVVNKPGGGDTPAFNVPGVGPVEIAYGPAFFDAHRSLNQALMHISLIQLNNAISEEIGRQYRKWGDQYHTVGEWLAQISAEEFGEAVKALNEGDLDQCEKEVVETIACLAQTYHEIQRKKGGLKDGNYTPVNTFA